MESLQRLWAQGCGTESRESGELVQCHHSSGEVYVPDGGDRLRCRPAADRSSLRSGPWVSRKFKNPTSHRPHRSDDVFALGLHELFGA